MRATKRPVLAARGVPPVLAARLGPGGALGVRVPGVDGWLGVGGALGVRGVESLACPWRARLLDGGGRHLACPAVGLAVVAVDLHSLHLLYSLMKDKLSHHNCSSIFSQRFCD